MDWDGSYRVGLAPDAQPPRRRQGWFLVRDDTRARMLQACRVRAYGQGTTLHD